ncbi:MAG: cytochrome c biogenesis protein CcsA [Spirochaetota bacterium]
MNLLYYLPWLSAALIVASVILAVKSFKKDNLLKVARYSYYGATAVTALMLIALTIGFVFNAFQFSYVYQHSSLDLPLMYRIAAVWAGQEGSFLLWTFFVMVTVVLALRYEKQYTQSFLTLAGLVTLVFIIHCLHNNPFAYIWDSSKNVSPGVIPHDGMGLNPLLQDFWMVIHPPVLFVGYALATVPFVYAIIALLYNDYLVMTACYRWVVALVLALGAGIFLGGYWAYKVLGWGGYWGWDPVENASLIPWLTGLALMHGLMVQKRKGALIRFNSIMAIVTFLLVIFGTFLTRSGVLSDFSVHSFSGSGNFTDLLLFIVTVGIIAMGLLLYRRNDAIGTTLDNTLFAKDNIIVYGVAALLFFALFILIGTCMPIITGLLGQASTVQESYYVSITRPIGFLIAVLLLLTPFAGKPSLKTVLIAGTIALTVSLLLFVGKPFVPVAFILMVLSFGILLTNVKGIVPHIPLNLSARIAHSGVALLIIGIITSQTQSVEYHAQIAQNEKKTLYPITLELVGMVEGIKSAIEFKYEYYNTSKTIHTPYFINTRTNQLFREPYIDYNLHYDVYISPVEYRWGKDILTQIMLKKGEVRSFNDVTIRFDGFDIDRMAMMQGNPKIYALFTVKYQGKEYTLRPGVIFDGDRRTNLNTVLPGTTRTISLMDFDIHEKVVVLYMDAPAQAAVPPDLVIVDISFKRLIWSVWLGTVVVAIGTALPLIKRQKNT